MNQTLIERDSSIATLNQTLIEHDSSIATLNQTLIEHDSSIATLVWQRELMNADLQRLNTERATFGAKIGRGITKIRSRIAPVNSFRGKLITALSRVATNLYIFGLSVTADKCWRHGRTYLRGKVANLRVKLNLATGNNQKPNSITRLRDEHQIVADYPELASWIVNSEPDKEKLSKLASEVNKFRYKPLISVILPIYKVPKDVLHKTIQSLEEQIYPNWEACIVWSDIDDLEGWKWLRIRLGDDERFKAKLLSENGGISRNSNEALKLVTGEFTALLDHDDTISPAAFFEVALFLQNHPETDFFYSDKDSITADGRTRLNALFKPEWSPEMLHSVNYLTHLNVIRTACIQEIGGWRPETDGAQDWDLFFRVTENTKNIIRIPSIQYHWRILPTSTATGLAAKPYAALGQLKSQQDYFLRHRLPASVVPSPEGMFHVRWPSKKNSVDVVIYQDGTIEELVRSLDSLRAVKQESINSVNVLHKSSNKEKLSEFEKIWPGRIYFEQVEDPNWSLCIRTPFNKGGSKTILLLSGSISGISESLIEELSGWVNHHPDIAWASAIALNKNNLVYEGGRVVGESGQSAPMFRDSQLHSFSWFGGPLWYRNSRACSPYAVAINGDLLSEIIGNTNQFSSDLKGFVALCGELLTNEKRGLINPFAKVYFDVSPEASWSNDGSQYHCDPFFNPAFLEVSPLRLYK